jgi:hypothetical protein
MLTTEKEDRMYWHVNIMHVGEKFILIPARSEIENKFDISKYRI